MSLNRLLYDKCYGEKKLEESIRPGLYNTNTPVICGNCLPENPEIMPNRTGVSINSNVPGRFFAGPIDIESDLRNINRVASRCPTLKYNPTCPNCKCRNQGEPCGQGVVAGCKMCGAKLEPEGKASVEGFNSKETEQVHLRSDGKRCGDNNLIDFPGCNFNIEDTRLSNPPSTLRGTGVNRFTPLLMNPQENIFFPGEYHIPSRTDFRDNHRPCLPSLKTINQNPMSSA